MANDIGWAVNEMRAGMRVCRAGWNGKGMWLVLVEHWQAGQEREDVADFTGNPNTACLPFVGMKTADNKFMPWLCSQTDMLAMDWELVT